MDVVIDSPGIDRVAVSAVSAAASAGTPKTSNPAIAKAATVITESRGSSCLSDGKPGNWWGVQIGCSMKWDGGLTKAQQRMRHG